MEYLKNMLSDIQERYRNPLIGSFTLSWIFWNWKISSLTIHFFTDSNSLLKFEDYIKGVIEFSNVKDSLLFPLLSSFIYVTLFPFIKNVISFLDAFYSKQQNSFIEKGSKESGISIKKYLNLKAEYKSKIEELKQIIDSEDIYRQKNNSLISEITELRSNLKAVNEDYVNCISKSNISVLKGFWKLNFTKLNTQAQNVYRNTEFINRELKFDKIEILFNEIKIYSKLSKDPIFQGSIVLFENDVEKTSKESKAIQITFLAEVDFGSGFVASDFNAQSIKGKIYLLFKLNQTKNYEILSGTINEFLKIDLIKE
jgi:hypothetical protein